jgi:excisionase family DNA binding protein
MTLLTVKDMATWLQVKDKTIYAWVSQGKIPCVKVNGVIRFDERAIERWLQTCHVPIGPSRMLATNRRTGSATSVDSLIESAKRAIYTPHGETRPVASPHGKERTHGAR